MKLNPVAERLLRIHNGMIRFRNRQSSLNPSKSCRICLETTVDPGDRWIRPCSCRGTVEWVHHECLKIWIRVSDRTTCDMCGTEYRLQKDTSIFKLYDQQVCWALTSAVVILCFYLSKRIFGFRSVWNSQYIRLTYISMALVLTLVDITLSYTCPDFYTVINVAIGDDYVYQENLLFIFVYIHRLFVGLYAKIPWKNEIRIESISI